MSPAAVAFLPTKVRLGRTASVRSVKRRTAGDAAIVSDGAAESGTDNDRTTQTCSPAIPSTSLLVATMRTPGQSRSTEPAKRRTASRRCSQLSRTNNDCFTRRNPRTLSSSETSARCTAPRVAATTCKRASASPAAASSHIHAPSRKPDNVSAATCSASRVFPTPPTPVSVINRSVSNDAATAATSSSRPTKLVNWNGRLFGNSVNEGTDGNASTKWDPRTWNRRSGRLRSRRRCSPRSTNPTSSGSRSRTNSTVADDNKICPPCATLHDPRRLVHRLPRIVTGTQLRRAAMQAHPHPQRAASPEDSLPSARCAPTAASSAADAFTKTA